MTSEMMCHWANPAPDEVKLYGEVAVKRNRAQHLVEECAAIETRQRAWHDMNLWNATLFSNREVAGFHWGQTNQTAGSELFPSNLVTENLVLSIGNWLLSKGASSPIKPTPITRGSSFKTKRLVRKLDRWTFGTWRQLKCESLARRALMDAYLSGLGCVKFHYDKNGVGCESVFFDNVIIDNRECLNRAPPRTFRIRSIVPTDAVKAKYKTEFEAQGHREFGGYEVGKSIGDGYSVFIEAWTLPGPNGEPGRHSSCADGVLCDDEEWKHDWVPLVFLDWGEKVSGFLGPTGVETVVPYQIQLNEVNERIRDAQHLCTNPRLLAHVASRIDVNQITNAPGSIVTWGGSIAPVPLVWPAAPAELYNERERIKTTCFEFFGASQMTAQQKLPTGARLDSSRAIGEVREMEDQQFLALWTRYEDFRMEMARRMIDVMCVEPERNHVTTWYSGGRARAENISWKDVAVLQKDRYTWSLEAIPMSSASVGARQDLLDTAAGRGLFGPDEQRGLASHPDIESIEDLEMASQRGIMRLIEKMEDGDFEAPDATTNLVYGIPKVTYNLETLKDCSEDREDSQFATDEEFEEAEELLFTAKNNHLRFIRLALALQNPVINDPTMQAPGPGPAMGIGGMELPNNEQGLPGQPFGGAPGGVLSGPTSEGAGLAPPIPPMGPPGPGMM